MSYTFTFNLSQSFNILSISSILGKEHLVNDVDITNEHDCKRKDNLSTSIDPSENMLKKVTIARIISLDEALLINVRINRLLHDRWLTEAYRYRALVLLIHFHIGASAMHTATGYSSRGSTIHVYIVLITTRNIVHVVCCVAQFGRD